MARYIDADKIDYKFIVVGMDENAGYRAVAFESDIDEIPTADVVPKSEFNKTIAEWAYLHADVLNKLENAKAEVAREIFEEIEKVVNYALCVDITDWSAYTELKKKYTEENNV